MLAFELTVLESLLQGLTSNIKLVAYSTSNKNILFFDLLQGKDCYNNKLLIGYLPLDKWSA